jgi:hypothetical protein
MLIDQIFFLIFCNLQRHEKRREFTKVGEFYFFTRTRLLDGFVVFRMKRLPNTFTDIAL